MLNLGQKGVAGLTVAVAAIAMAGASVGTPVAVDEMDVQPDSPLYSLERAGESIKESTYAGGQDWNIERAEERTREFEKMVKENKGKKFKGLANEASERLIRATKKAKNENGLERAQEALRKHVRVLERVRENVPDQAQAAISLAISASTRSQGVIAKVKAGEIPGPRNGGTPEEAKEQLNKVRNRVTQMEKEIEENIERAKKTGKSKGKAARRAANRIETQTAKKISEVIENMKGKVDPDEVEQLAEEAENRINTAMRTAVDNTGIERAIEASQKHLSVLEGLENKVPKQAQEAIQRAISNSQRHIQRLREIRENLNQENIFPGNIGEGIGEGPPKENEDTEEGPPEEDNEKGKGPNEGKGPA